MKVMHLISSGGMYGAEAVILNLSAELESWEGRGSALAVFAHDGAAEPGLHTAAVAAGLQSSLVPCHGQLDLGFAERLRDLVRQSGTEVLHAHGYKADIYAYLAFRTGPRPALVSTCHTWYDNDLAVRLYGAADRWVLRAFDEVVSVSPEVSDRLLASGVASTRIHLIRNGISLRPFGGPDQLRPSDHPVTVGLVGRLAYEKGIDVFLRAAAIALRRFPQARFVVAGEGPDRLNLEALLSELRLQESVNLVGAQTDMPTFYRSLDILVSASRQEGLPVALLEGMASGLPVVATTVGAVPQVVVHAQTGTLVAPNSPEALAGGIVDLIASGQRRKTFGQAGRRRIEDYFSAERMAKDYVAVYERALRRVARAKDVR